MTGSALLAQATFSGPEVDWFGLSPLIVLTGGCLVLMVAAALVPGRWPRGGYALFTGIIAVTAGTFGLFLWDDVQEEGPRGLVGDAIGLDGFSVFFTLVICATVLLGALFLDDYLRREDLDGCEVYALVLLAAVGGIVLASANDLIVLFLGLETLSLAQYVMAASHMRRFQSQESAIKYFILGGFSSAFLLYGIASPTARSGRRTSPSPSSSWRSRARRGRVAARRHRTDARRPRVQDLRRPSTRGRRTCTGAPTPVTGFMASAAKAAAFGALLRVIVVAFNTCRDDWQPVLWVLAVVTLVVGSVLAVVQTNVKRMLAYSSVSHAGFILVGVEAARRRWHGWRAVLCPRLRGHGARHVRCRRARGPHGRRPHRARRLPRPRRYPPGARVHAHRVPPGAGRCAVDVGFVAKFGVIAAAVEQAGGFGYSLAIIAMLSAVIAAFVYLRIIVACTSPTRCPPMPNENRWSSPCPRAPASCSRRRSPCCSDSFPGGPSTGPAMR